MLLGVTVEIGLQAAQGGDELFGHEGFVVLHQSIQIIEPRAIALRESEIDQ